MTKKKGGPGESRVDGVLDQVVESINEKLPESVRDDGRGRWSYDWCRFRRSERCWFPQEINWDATREAGYIVWIPVNRGFCPHSRWEDQQGCQVGEPGPNSGDPNALIDATIAWEDGGQRDGVPDRQPPEVPSGQDGIAAELERLATLHATGALTDAEFAAAKARVLGH